jgi:hypothetical protein
MGGGTPLERGREAFRGKAWRDAFTRLRASDTQRPLGLADLESLAEAAYLCGCDAESETVWARAHAESLARQDWARAARCAFWLAITLNSRSERAKAGGWLARAQRTLEDSGHDCAERGWLLIPVGLERFAEHDRAGALAMFVEAGAIGAQHGDEELVTVARQAQGRCLLRLGETNRGLALLDEAMVAVAAGDVSPIPAGIVYCSVIEVCQEILDVQRAQQWTTALSDWCDAQPGIVPDDAWCTGSRSCSCTATGPTPSRR